MSENTPQQIVDWACPLQGDSVVVQNGFAWIERTPENARKVKAAPDYYDAVEAIIQRGIFEDDYGHRDIDADGDLWAAVVAAHAKAKGETP